MSYVAPTIPVSYTRTRGGRVRIAPWRGDSSVAALTPLCPSDAVTPELLRALCHDVRRLGYESAITSALMPVEADVFVRGGFSHRETLILLRRHSWRLGHLGRGGDHDPDSTWQLRAATPSDTDAIVQLDSTAFEKNWQLDAFGLREARAATARTHMTVVTNGDQVIGYAVTGASKRDGFIQRLAVDTEYRRQGLGRRLVINALRWLRRNLVIDAIVNTQIDNDGALRLYQQLGFEVQNECLSVLGIDLR